MTLTYYFMVVATFALLQSFAEVAAQQCRSQYSILGMMLRGHTFKTLNTSISFECNRACNDDIRCHSFNYVIKNNVCELNNRTKEARPENFVADAQRYYFRRQKKMVPLGSIPELPAETCKEIKASEGGQAESGKYWFNSIIPGETVLAQCDMQKEDVDECSASLPVCDFNATCQNNDGSYDCSCKPGFTGDGKSCSDIDECSASVPVCDVNADCQNNDGSYVCSCKDGFTGNGKTCFVACAGTITAVGSPVTHHTRYYTWGAWMKDPFGIMGSDTIFVMKSYSGQNVLEEFENMDQFKTGVTRKTYTLPYNWQGTGGVVYGQYLYYNRASTAYIVKYNLQTEEEEAQILLSDFTYGTSYQWGGGNGVDLAIDEQGLWVLWGSNVNSKRLKAAKIDVEGNNIIQTWALNTESMARMGNAFVACGVVYCIDSYSASLTTINFAYDTKTGTQWNPNIQFRNQYGYNSMVHYNPREKVLYAWDSKRQVTYSLTF